MAGSYERSDGTVEVQNGLDILHVAARMSASQEKIRSSLSKEFLMLIFLIRGTLYCAKF